MMEVSMDRLPKAWMFTLGLSVLAVVASMIASSVKPAFQSDEQQAAIEAESCVRYGRFECCVKPD
jgi:hypothetical protein